MATISQPRNLAASNIPTNPTTPTQTFLTQAHTHLTLSIALLLSSWPPLALAISESWGGPDSAAKKDWLCGVLSDLFEPPPAPKSPANSRPPLPPPAVDQEDVETLLLQVMQDEFDVRLEDDSEVDLARDILTWCARCYNLEEGERWWSEIRAWYARWEEKQKRGKEKVVGIVRGQREGGEDESSSEDEDEEDGGVSVNGDVEMVDVPNEGRSRRVEEVDEEGFTKVVKRGKR
ncbi:MAG: hypothetical protein Q9162_003327 [Coniocarpon cinnabarinum]